MNREKALRFIHEYGRSLDLAVYDYHMHNGSPQKVQQELLAYQNADGGFGHGLEMDYLNPHSTPIAVNEALHILHRVSLLKKDNPVVQGIVSWLTSGDGYDRQKHRWLFAVASNLDYPHAAWWEKKGDGISGMNPSVSLAAVCIAMGEGTAEYEQIVREAYEGLKQETDVSADMLKCHLLAWHLLKENHVENLIPLSDYFHLIQTEIIDTMERDVSIYDTTYVNKPSDYFCGINPEFTNDEIRMMIINEISMDESRQKEDGGFEISWNWSTPYVSEFEQARKKWRAKLTIDHLIFNHLYTK
ncbi:MAG: hypothetical protein ACI32N_02000 [Bulleidia sp.]